MSLLSKPLGSSHAPPVVVGRRFFPHRWLRDAACPLQELASCEHAGTGRPVMAAATRSYSTIFDCGHCLSEIYHPTVDDYPPAAAAGQLQTHAGTGWRILSLTYAITVGAGSPPSHCTGWPDVNMRTLAGRPPWQLSCRTDRRDSDHRISGEDLGEW